MMHPADRIRSISRAGLAMALCALLLATAVPAEAQGRRRGGTSQQDRDLRALVAPVVESVRHSVVTISDGDDALGLGTVVDGRGYILAKASELYQAETLVCTTSDGEEYAARLVGRDNANDLAMLHIDASDLSAVSFVEHEPGIGEVVVVAGPEASPRRLGIVSTQMRRVAPRRLVLGVMLSPDGEGLVVTNLTEGYGAARAGIKVGDIITHVMGEEVEGVRQIVMVLQGRSVGDTVGVELLREGEPVELDIELTEMAPDPDSRGERMNRMGGEVSERNVGFEQVFQHDAVIRPVDCGGPVVNLDGEVIGLNIARAGRIATYALPASLLVEVVGELIALDHEPAAVEPGDGGK